MKRLKYISMLLLLIVALQAAGQTIDKVCVGSERKYRINGEDRSTYLWLLNDPSGNPVKLSNPTGTPFTSTKPDGTILEGNEVTIQWNQAGTFNLSAVQYSIHGCDTLEQGDVEVFELPVAIAGNPLSICSGSKVEPDNSSANHYSSLLWITSGDGFFNDPTVLHSVYNGGPKDLISGIVKLTLIAQGLGNGNTCRPDSSTLTATFKVIPKLVITDPPSVCSPQTIDLSAASVTKGSDPDLTFEYYSDSLITKKLINFKTVSKSGTYYIMATNANECSVIESVKVIFDQLIVPSLPAIQELCLNSTPPDLPPSSYNGITGQWTPALISTNTLGKSSYVFSPDAGQCSKDTTFVIVVTNSIIPTFSINNSICLGSDPPNLPLVSNNGITGTWDPKIILTNSIGKYTFTFIPDLGQCGETITKDITITYPSTLPNFSFNTILCQNSTPPLLPPVSDEGIKGTWEPAAISTNTNGIRSYTFKPYSGQCVQQRVVAVEVVNKIVPDFDPISPLCLGSAPITLPSTSKNGISGIWAPAVVAANIPGNALYTFTPDGNQCAVVAQMNVRIYEKIVVVIKADALLALGGTTKVTVTAGGGSGNYVSGIGVFDKGAGTHSFTVTDDAGCSGTATIYINNPQDFKVAATITELAGCIGGMTKITATATGGTAPYIFTLTGGNPATTRINDYTFYVNASDIPYHFTVLDANGLSSESDPLLVSDPPMITLTMSFTSPTCLGGTDGTAMVIPQEGTKPYYYLWNDPLKQTTATVSGLKAGKYTVKVTDAHGCAPVTAEVTVPEPPAMTIAAKGIDPICPGGNGSILFTFVNVPDGIYDIQYDGSKFSAVQTVGNKATVAAPAATYNNLKLIIKGCSTVNADTITLNDPPKQNITCVPLQPTCKTPTGTIVVTDPLQGTGFNYKLNAGLYQPSSTFIGLIPGSYLVKVKNLTTGCESEKTIIINQVPLAPVAPTASVTVQPDCLIPRGTIVVTSPLGAGYMYSINGSAFQLSPVFAGLSPGVYSVKVKETASGCESTPKVLTINSVPLFPTKLVASVTAQPSCSLPTGTIVITDPLGPGYKYSLDGITYQSSPVFTGLAPGVYSLRVKETASGCESTFLTLSINAVPLAPASVLASVTVQTSCTVSTGTISVTSPLSSGYRYSLDGITFQLSPVFAGLSPGVYIPRVKEIATGCESISTGLTINKVPMIPATPVASAVQPNCNVPTGTIEVRSPLNSGYEYSLDGITYQSSPVFAGLAPRVYSLRVKETVLGCDSKSTMLTISNVALAPATPVANVVVQPTCNNPDGTVLVTDPKEGTGFEYSIDNGAYQTAATFTGLVWGKHIIRVKQTSSGCESDEVAKVTVNAVPPQPILTITKVDDSKCFDGDGSISFEFTNVPDGSYIIAYDGGQFTRVNISNNTAKVIAPAGTYNNLKIEANGCISDKNMNAIISQPDEIVIAAKITEIDLKSQRKGAISLTVSGGTGSYSYKWDNGATTSDLKNLSDGIYTVWVTDQNNCKVFKTMIMPVPNFPPVAVNDKYSIGCSAATGNLLANDYDQEKDTFFIDVIPVESPKHGQLTLNQDGSFIYQPTSGFYGTEVFRYAIYDVKHYLGDTASVFISIVPDMDCDGIPDSIDPDADGDGILNVNEGSLMLDSDGDGFPNWLDIDADNDGIVDNIEAQGIANYIPPSGKDTDGDGIDDAYDTDQGGKLIVPIDTDGDWIPDFLDADSDNDMVPDYIEGHDKNADGKPDHVLVGKDSDADGLDDGFDTVDRNKTSLGNVIGSNATIQDFDGDGAPDWRDDNDDNDEYLTRFEDLNADGDYSNDDIDFDGHPEYLDYGRECDMFIPDAFSPNSDNIHEYFQIYCIDHFPNAKMYIFDQLGNKLFEKEHYGNLDFWGSPDRAWWDGKTNNRSVAVDRGMVPAGTYYYVLQLGNGEVKKSFVFVSY